MPKHLNTGSCPKCVEIFSRLPCYAPIREWFVALQKAHPEAHISCAGRGKVEQELYFTQKTSKAHWTQSSHNYGAAVDIFQLDSHGAAAWPQNWFSSIVAPAVHASTEPVLKWYGEKGAPYFELPHVEVANWKELVKSGILKLVEQAPA